MQPENPILVQGASPTLAVSQNRVLRNTYLLLALSMVPTILGAWLGVQLKFSFFAGSPVIGGCPIFPATSVWNRSVDRLPVALHGALTVDS